MKKFYQKHPLLVILVGIITTMLIGIVVLSALLLPQSKTAKQITYPLYTLKSEADQIFKGHVVAKSSTDYQEDASLGLLSQVNVTEGQEVKTGDVLLTYNRQTEDLSSQEFAVRSAENDLTNAQADLAEAEKKDTSLRVTFNQSKEEAEKQNIETQIESNQEAWKAAQRAVMASSLALEQAQASLANQTARQTATVIAKTDGLVVMGNNSETLPILSVVSRDTLVMGKVSEYDYHQLKQDTVVGIETIDLSKKVTGKISWISPVPDKATADSVSSYYTFKVVLDEPLQNGYNVQIHLANDALFVPKSAVKNGQVYVKSGQTYKKVAVETQAVNHRLQILSGLKLGDKIIKEASDYVDTP